MENTKICKKCNKEKSLDDFNYTNRKKGYKESYCKPCKGTYIDSLRRRDSKKEYQRERRWKLRKIGTSIEEVKRLYEEQEGKCKISSKYAEKLHVDHCHRDNKFRGLLHTSINTSLGKFEDNINWLTKAIIYLLETKSDKNTNTEELQKDLDKINTLISNKLVLES